MKIKKTLISLCAMAVLTGGAVVAPAYAETTTSVSRNLSDADHDLLWDIMELNMAEINAAKVALNKSHDLRVRDHAKMMLRDHTATLNQLRGLATRLGLDMPDEPNHWQRDDYNGLSGRFGTFEEAYMDLQVRQHERAIELHREAGRSGHTEFAEFFNGAIPTLQAHLEHSRHVLAQVDEE